MEMILIYDIMESILKLGVGVGVGGHICHLSSSMSNSDSSLCFSSLVLQLMSDRGTGVC